MMDKELIDKMLIGIRRELEKAHTWSCRFEKAIEETTQPLDSYPTFEPTDQMTITIEINKPDEAGPPAITAGQADALRFPR